MPGPEGRTFSNNPDAHQAPRESSLGVPRGEGILVERHAVRPEPEAIQEGLEREPVDGEYRVSDVTGSQDPSLHAPDVREQR